MIVDDGRRNSYAQALNHHGTLLLEYRDGSPQRHFQACGVGLDDLADALSQWSRGERDFIEHHTWRRLEYWDKDEAPGSERDDNPEQVRFAGRMCQR